MPVAVKICGLKSIEALDAALDVGADYVGLVVYPPSPRHIAPADAAPLANRARGRAKIVALVVDADDALLADIVRQIAPDILQLHGSETPQRTAEIRRRFGVKVMKVINVETAADVATAAAFDGQTDMILFDAKAPKSLKGALPGGNGLTFDWRALDAVRGKIDFMLSGGLTPANVAAAIQLTGARAVDVSSGVESAPGIKDPALIRKFIAAVRAAEARP